LTPLGPAPINFINEQVGKGFPVIFSILNDETKRINNILSSIQTDIATNASEVYFNALPGNEYDFEWLGSEPIGVLTTDPSLPSWITVVSTDGGVVKLHIDTMGTTEDGDYMNVDYNEDYMTLSFNSLVGCYSYDFFNDGVPLFTLNICVYPSQGINSVCKKGYQNPIFNLAWVNRQGGWSSYCFEGKKEIRRKIGKESTFKRGSELKKASIENVYTEVVVNFAGKTIRDLQFLDTLRTSIQAYLFNDSTLQWDIPIVLDREDFPIYSLPFKQSDQKDSFTFVYSEELVIQKQ
jgi:hypothetical protein